MSQDDGLTPYYQSGDVEVDHRDINASGDEHPFGSEPKEWEADLRQFIKDVADDLYESWEDTVREYLANAETACLKVQQFVDNPEESPYEDMDVSDSYQPRIVVTWDRKAKKLIIQDNGIGMAAIEVDEVFRHIGRSAARDLGVMSGSFGMGAISFPKFIGMDNTMIMISNSRLNGDNAAYLVTLAGVEPIRGSLGEEEFGTVFKLDQKKDEMDVRSAIERYAEWMRVPVLYTEFNENGEEVYNEDYGNKRLYDRYEDESEYVERIAVDEAFEAYMSIEADQKTLLLSMDIDRNESRKFTAPYDFDVRLLDESGKVFVSSNGNEGLIPVSMLEYKRMLLDARPDHIADSLLDSKDIVANEFVGEEFDYVLDNEVLNSGKPLPRADYVESADDGQIGDKVVIIGPNKGKKVVSKNEWDELPEGRASRFVPESELEEYDLKTGEGDLCLPKPTTNRSSLQKHEKFWKYIAIEFAELYNRKIDEWDKKILQAENVRKAIEESEITTVRTLKEEEQC